MSDDIFRQFEEQFYDIYISENDVTVVTDMSTGELVDKIHSITSELFEMREAVNPKTQIARDLHSLRNACQVELSKRV